jgi:hypothetical protein
MLQPGRWRQPAFHATVIEGFPGRPAAESSRPQGGTFAAPIKIHLRIATVLALSLVVGGASNPHNLCPRDEFRVTGALRQNGALAERNKNV